VRGEVERNLPAPLRYAPRCPARLCGRQISNPGPARWTLPSQLGATGPPGTPILAVACSDTPFTARPFAHVRSGTIAELEWAELRSIFDPEADLEMLGHLLTSSVRYVPLLYGLKVGYACL
jgi:hypothetical protein